MLIFWLKEKFEKFKNRYTFFQLLLFYIHGSPLCIPFNYNNNNNKRSIQLFFLFFEIYIKLQESRIRSTIYSPETKSPSQEEKKNYEAKYDNQNLNNENYHRLNHIVKKPFCPVQLDSNALLFPKKYTHTPIFRIGIFLAAPLVFHRVFPCTQQ